jgi:hypothetical protein
MHSAVHLRSAAQVRSSSWVAVPAVTVPIDHGRVLKIQLAIQAPMALFHCADMLDGSVSSERNATVPP